MEVGEETLGCFERILASLHLVNHSALVIRSYSFLTALGTVYLPAVNPRPWDLFRASMEKYAEEPANEDVLGAGLESIAALACQGDVLSERLATRGAIGLLFDAMCVNPQPHRTVAHC